ncbi:hypothetical protein, partial [Bacillus cereus]|uniref:hypothetical protein n=1 Tax=Bacillus cereus TaxID=1396 RepID=UPI001BAE8928
MCHYSGSLQYAIAFLFLLGVHDNKKAPYYRALPLLVYLAPAARMVGGFASSVEVKSTSMSEAPS